MFSTFDLKSAYHHISLIESEQKYTVFGANGNEFQRKMREFIEVENLNGGFLYVDNITITGCDQADHDRNVASLIDSIQRRKFTLNESKATSSVEFLNILHYIAGNINIRADPERKRALQDFPVPNNKNFLCRVLGMFAYYAKHINCLSTKVRPLAEAKTFPLASSVWDVFVLIKFELLESSLQSID